MFEDVPTVPDRTYSRPTVPMRAVPAPRARGTQPPADIDAITRAEFEACCWYAPTLTTPLAWFRRRDGSALGLLLRDHTSTTFSVVTFLLVDDGVVLDQRRDGIDERGVAIGELVELVAATSWTLGG